MAILKKSNRSYEKTKLPFLYGDAEKASNSSESTTNRSINKSNSNKNLLHGGAHSSTTLVVERLKEITSDHVESTPENENNSSFSSQEVPSKQVSIPHIDQKEIDRQLQVYRKKTELALQAELDTKRTAFMTQVEIEKAQLLDQAYQDGYNQGEQEGRGILEHQAEEFLAAMNRLTQEKGEIFVQARPDILKLSIKIAEKIIQKSISDQPDLFESIIDEAIAKVTDKDKVIIRVNPAQIDTVRKYKDRLLERINDIKSLEIQDDPKIESGGCLIETKLGYVDATLPIKLATLQNALLKTMEEEPESAQS